MTSTSSVVASLLAQILRDLDIDVIAIDRYTLSYIPVNIRRKSENVLHYLANLIINEKVRVCLDEVYGIVTGFYKGITLLYTTRRSTKSKAVVVKKSSPCSKDVTLQIMEKLIKLLPKTPLFIVDLSLWELHHEREKRNLIKQLVITINVVRRFLTDLNLVLISTPTSVIQELQNIVSNKVMYFVTDEFYRMLPLERTIVLDPYASEELVKKDVHDYDYFVIGGVVNRVFPRPYATYTIHRLHKLNFVRKVIKLHGSIIGVPNELNKIIDIILNVRLCDMDLDKAIKTNMSVNDKLVRVIYEVRRKIKSGEEVSENDIDDIMKFYGLDEYYKPKVMSVIKRIRCS